MDNELQRPNAALINKEWYQAAKGALTSGELSNLLVKCVEYVFTGDLGIQYDTMVETVFLMVRPSLDSDIAKYRERCMRNAANAKSRSERVAASGSESRRVVANTTTTSTTTSTTTPISLSDEEKQREIEREKWLIYGYFWATGSKAIKEETLAFWSYYEALGWKNNKGAAIVSKLAAARMWRRQFENGIVPNGSAAWYKAVEECPIPDYNIWNTFKGAEISPEISTIHLGCTDDFLRSLRAKVPNFERILLNILKTKEVCFEVIRPQSSSQ